LAAQIGLKAAAITRIELGRVPLKYDLARILFSLLKVNPKWVATGNGSPDAHVDLPHAIALNINGNATFSSVFFSDLWPIFKSDKPESEAEEIFRHTRSKIKAAQIEIWFQSVPDGYARELANGLENFWKEFYSKLPPEDAKIKLRRALRRASFQVNLKQRIAMQKETAGNKVVANAGSGTAVGKSVLDKENLPAMLPGMRLEVPTWPELKKTIKRLTAERGEKKALADKIGVSRQVLGNWLSDASQGAPNADLTLELLKWSLGKTGK
jgi:transcriptional regulator with XRE-family HTH domain